MKVFKNLAIGLAFSLVALAPVAHSGLSAPGGEGTYTVTCYAPGGQSILWKQEASTKHGANQLARSCQGIAVIAYEGGQNQ